MNYKGIMICSDIDGTLTVDGKISDENMSAIEKFTMGGGKFVLSTGRMPDYPKKSLNFNFKQPVMSLVSSYIYDFETEKLLLDLPVTKEDKVIIKQIYDEYKCYFEKFYICKLNKRIDGTTNADFESMMRTKFYKYAFYSENGDIAAKLQKDIIKKYGEYLVIDRGSPRVIEIHTSGSGKDSGLKFLKEYYGIKTAYAVGNFDNDIQMIKAADVGCAVENAIKSLKDIADEIVPSNENNAIAYIINNLIGKK